MLDKESQTNLVSGGHEQWLNAVVPVLTRLAKPRFCDILEKGFYVPAELNEYIEFICLISEREMPDEIIKYFRPEPKVLERPAEIMDSLAQWYESGRLMNRISDPVGVLKRIPGPWPWDVFFDKILVWWDSDPIVQDLSEGLLGYMEAAVALSFSGLVSRATHFLGLLMTNRFLLELPTDPPIKFDPRGVALHSLIALDTLPSPMGPDGTELIKPTDYHQRFHRVLKEFAPVYDSPCSDTNLRTISALTLLLVKFRKLPQVLVRIRYLEESQPLLSWILQELADRIDTYAHVLPSIVMENFVVLSQALTSIKRPWPIIGPLMRKTDFLKELSRGESHAHLASLVEMVLELGSDIELDTEKKRYMSDLNKFKQRRLRSPQRK